MSLTGLEEKIKSLYEFSAIGGLKKSVSYPLYREAGGEAYIVHLVYSYSPYVPSGFVLTPVSTGEPEYKTISEALSVLGLTQDDFDFYKGKNEEPAQDVSGLSEYTPDAFYALFDQPVFDKDIYMGYVYSILPFLEPEERIYYMPFI